MKVMLMATKEPFQQKEATHTTLHPCNITIIAKGDAQNK
jgi:hypothetical protein